MHKRLYARSTNIVVYYTLTSRLATQLVLVLAQLVLAHNLITKIYAIGSYEYLNLLTNKSP